MVAMEIPLLSLQGVSTCLNGSRVLHDISLDIHRNLVTTIIGPSGSGKTTLLRTMNLLLTPDQGRLVFNGETMFDAATDAEIMRSAVADSTLNRLSSLFRSSGLANRDHRRRFGMVFQDYNLWPNLTIYDNIAAPLRWSLHLPEADIGQTIEEYAEIVRITHILAKYPSEASGGERQRAAIARALVTKPEILLLDEVTSALDVELAAEVLKIIMNLKERGYTMVLVTHHLHFAERVSDVLVFLSNGRAVEKGRAETLFSNPQTSELSQFLEHLKL